MARDGYERWVAESLWELIPAWYRHEDGLADPPDVLRALVEVWAAAGGPLRRSQDRLWDDAFVETADDWAVPYLGDLVATRLVSAQNPRGRRVDVAKTVYYRRRAGTVRILEELVRDIGGWEGRVVESFRRLARTPHRLDPPLVGRIPAAGDGGWELVPGTRPPAPGGVAELRDPLLASLAGGPFALSASTPDLRRARGRLGHLGVPKLAVHVYRMTAWALEGVTPATVTDTGTGATIRTFDPSGRDVPLYVRSSRPASYEAWRSGRAWELPQPMTCRLLGHARYRVDDAVIRALVEETGLPDADAEALERLAGAVFPDAARLRRTLESVTTAVLPPLQERWWTLLRTALLDDTGKARLWPESVAVVTSEGAGAGAEGVVPGERTAPATLDGIVPTAPVGVGLLVDPARGRFVVMDATLGEARTVRYHEGRLWPIGAGSFARIGLSAPSTIVSGGAPLLAGADDDAGVVRIADSATYTTVTSRPAVTALEVHAADGERPYLRLAADWELTGAGQSTLLLDGLWIGGADVRLHGNWESVVIRACTFDPGGVDAGGNPLHPVRLVIEGQIDRLSVESSVLGRVRAVGATVEELVVTDTIVQAPASDPVAVATDAGEVRLTRVTVLGRLDVHRLAADTCVLTGRALVRDPQHGCTRYTAWRDGSRLPRPYESASFPSFAGVFRSTRFGDPHFGVLAPTAPEALRRGGADGGELGAYADAATPVKHDGLAAKIEEFLPFGRLAALIEET